MISQKRSTISSITSRSLQKGTLTKSISGDGRSRRGMCAVHSLRFLRFLCFSYTSFGAMNANSRFRYFSPYPLTETESEEQVTTPGSHGSTSAANRIPGVSRSSFRSHGRTSDLLAGGLGRSHGIEKSMLWVCDKCFKYMAEGLSWELHVVSPALTGRHGRLIAFIEKVLPQTSTRSQGISERRTYHLGSGRCKREGMQRVFCIGLDVDETIAILPKFISLWEAIHRHQNAILRLR